MLLPGLVRPRADGREGLPHPAGRRGVEVSQPDEILERVRGPGGHHPYPDRRGAGVPAVPGKGPPSHQARGREPGGPGGGAGGPAPDGAADGPGGRDTGGAGSDHPVSDRGHVRPVLPADPIGRPAVGRSAAAPPDPVAAGGGRGPGPAGAGAVERPGGGAFLPGGAALQRGAAGCPPAGRGVGRVWKAVSAADHHRSPCGDGLEAGTGVPAAAGELQGQGGGGGGAPDAGRPALRADGLFPGGAASGGGGSGIYRGGAGGDQRHLPGGPHPLGG